MKKFLILFSIIVTISLYITPNLYAQPCLNQSNLVCAQRRANGAFVCEDNGLRCLDNIQIGQTGSCCFATPGPSPTTAAGVPTDITGVVGKPVPPAYIDTSPNAVNNYIPTIMNGLFFIGLIALLAYLIYGGVKWIMSGGDPKALTAARDTIMHAVIGIILLSIGLAISQIFSALLSGPSGPQFPVSSTTFTYYVCGYCPQNLSNGVCEQEALDSCNRAITVPIDSLTPAQKSSVCTTVDNCRRGCQQNHNYNPREYRNCRPPQ